MFLQVSLTIFPHKVFQQSNRNDKWDKSIMIAGKDFQELRFFF